MLKKLSLFVAMVAAAILCQTALAQHFPNRPVRIIVPWLPSGKLAQRVARAARPRSIGFENDGIREQAPTVGRRDVLAPTVGRCDVLVSRP